MHDLMSDETCENRDESGSTDNNTDYFFRLKSKVESAKIKEKMLMGLSAKDARHQFNRQELTLYLLERARGFRYMYQVPH